MAKIYLSSTYIDLKAYREAVYHVLRQTRHDVIAMEDYVAADQRPVDKCLTDVTNCDLYIGIFAWRYGFIPTEGNPQQKSVTELEYLKAFEEGKSRLIFILDKDEPWPPMVIDAMNGEGNQGDYIRKLRGELSQGKLVSFFKTPEHLASLVSSAVHLWEQEQKNRPITQSDYFEGRAFVAGVHTRLFDHIPCLQASLVDLELEKVSEFLKRDLVQRQEDFRSGHSIPNQLAEFGLLHEAHPTHGAILCFGHRPQAWITGAVTRCIYWRGNSQISGYINDQDCRGDLIAQFDSSLNFLRKCLRFSRIIGKQGRTERYEIPIVALQEAVANALVHREYASRGNGEEYITRTDCVQVEVFDDRVEIKSPGLLPPAMTVEALNAGHTSHPRNPLIARIFYLFGHVERVGSGLQRMRDAMEDEGLPPPRFDLSDPQTFTVILERPQQVPDEILESDEFGELLTQGLEGIAKRKNQPLESVIAEISSTMRVRNRPLLQKWQQGRISIPSSHVAALARSCVQDGDMDQAWLQAFLKAASYRDSKHLITELYPNPSLIESSELAKDVKHALDTYINSLLTDRNRIPLEFILAPEEFIKYETVPLPTVFTELDVIYRLALSQRNFSENGNDYGDGGAEGNSATQPVAAMQALAEKRHIVIEGDPGAGKTTLINYLCVIMASLLKGDQDAANQLNSDSNGRWEANEILFPISIRLRDFGRSPIFEEGQGSAANLAKYIAHVVAGEYNDTAAGPSIRGHVLDLLRKGGALIVMDGLDELPGEVYEIDSVASTDERDHRQLFRKTAKARMRLQRILNSFTEHAEYGKCRVVVTSRSYAYRSNAEWRLGPHFAEAHLRDFEPKQIQEYIRGWHIQIAKRMAKQNQSGTDPGKPEIDDKMIEATVSSFWEALEKNKHMLELARRPLILTFLVSRYATSRSIKSLPSVSKVNLYGEIVKMLTKFWSQHQIVYDDPDAPATLVDALGLQNDNQLELLLAAVAFEAQKGMEDAKDTRSAVITSDTLKRAWEKIGAVYKVGKVRPKVWMQLRERTGILLPYRTDDDGTEYFAFTHPSFQEWLAAKAIISASPAVLPIDYWPEKYRQDPLRLNTPDLIAGLIQIAHERWQEVIVLILESTFYDEPNTTWQIIERLVSEPIPEKPEDNRWYGALLAGDFLERNKEIVNYTGRSEPVAVRKWLVRSLQHQAMSIEDRVEAGRILAVLGDSRCQLEADPLSRFHEHTWSPAYTNRIDNLWVRVPDTRVMVGSPLQDVEGHRRERAEERRPVNCECKVQGYYVSRYHVTNDLFQCFIQDGYNRHDCWNWSRSSLHWHERNPLPEQSYQTRLGNAPCRIVSWYEAMAFCRWLTLINPFNLEVFLPGESEWLAAACSDPEGRFHDTVYVWGDSIDTQPGMLNYYGNTGGLNLNNICSVGIFQPNKLGIFDMCGNVAEWTRTIWRENLALPEKNDLEDLSRTQRAIRGCSYRDIDANIRVGHRKGLAPEHRSPEIGFRIAARVRN